MRRERSDRKQPAWERVFLQNVLGAARYTKAAWDLQQSKTANIKADIWIDFSTRNYASCGPQLEEDLNALAEAHGIDVDEVDRFVRLWYTRCSEEYIIHEIIF